jgi:hypothetical protein
MTEPGGDQELSGQSTQVLEAVEPMTVPYLPAAQNVQADSSSFPPSPVL